MAARGGPSHPHHIPISASSTAVVDASVVANAVGVVGAGAGAAVVVAVVVSLAFAVDSAAIVTAPTIATTNAYEACDA